MLLSHSCCCYHKGTYFQANHNNVDALSAPSGVVVATTKVRIFKQITTESAYVSCKCMLLLLPQRYVFSSKSQQEELECIIADSCCCYHKGTYFQANHNDNHGRVYGSSLLLLPQRYVFSSKSQRSKSDRSFLSVVVATTKVRIFKQITTHSNKLDFILCCCCYHKGTYFQANHNYLSIYHI